MNSKCFRSFPVVCFGSEWRFLTFLGIIYCSVKFESGQYPTQWEIFGAVHSPFRCQAPKYHCPGREIFFPTMKYEGDILFQWLLPRHSGLRPQFYILTLTAVHVHSPVFYMDADLVLLTPCDYKPHLSTNTQYLTTRGR